LKDTRRLIYIFLNFEADWIKDYHECRRKSSFLNRWTSSVFKSTGLARRDPKLIGSILSRLGFKTFIGYRWKKDHRLNHRCLWLRP
jgi:hypothetical protein